MADIKKIIADVESSVKKGIDTSSLNGGTGSATMTTRQDLDSVIVNLSNRNTPFRDMVRREAGQGAAFTFNVTSSLYGAAENTNPRETFYAEGGLPTMRNTQYGTKIVAYKSIGYQGSVTGLAQASGESVLDLYATEVERGTRGIIQAEEWLDFWSSTTTANTGGLYGYAGLDELITTNVIDAAGAVISKTLIDKAAKRIASHGGMATHMFCSLGIAADVNNLYNTYSQVIINGADRQALTYGNMVRNISTIGGVWDVVGDFFLNPGNTYPNPSGVSSYPTGATSSTVFILAMPFISMKDLKSIGMEELGRVADKRAFYVNEYTALKLTAEPWCAKITNVLEVCQ